MKIKKTKMPEYWIWAAMIRRCYNKNFQNYHRYGGRGIVVCNRWRHSFSTFLADMGSRPSENHSLDRFPDKDGNYEPENCRWATQTQQMRNRYGNRLIAFNGEVLPLISWSERLGLPYKMLHDRIAKHGWTIQRAFTTPARYLKNKEHVEGQS
jgi:hypothetical protein